MQFYGEDLACIHDEGFSGFARQTAPELLEILRQAGIQQGLVIDLGCGSGIWAAKLVEKGFRVVGLDISGPMVEMARRRVPQGEFRQESLFQARFPECEAVTALGESVSYAFDPQSGAAALRALLRRVHAALRPGGLLIFDFVQPGSLKKARFRKDFQLADDWAVMVEAEENEKSRELVRRITTFRRQGPHYRRSQEVHRLHTYPGVQLTGQLRGIGFRVRLVRGYGNYRFSRGVAGIIARKIEEP